MKKLNQRKKKKEAIDFLAGLGKEVAVAFLKYNVPIIRKSEWATKSLEDKNVKLKSIVKRFFNVEAEAKVEEGDRFGCVRVVFVRLFFVYSRIVN